MTPVVGAVITREGLIFAARTRAGSWEFPGGKVEAGESPQTALSREIREELLCEILVGAHLITVEHGEITLSTYYCTLIDDSTPRLTEHVEARWYSPSELADLSWLPADLATVRLLSA